MTPHHNTLPAAASIDPLRNLDHMASLIAEVTGEPVQQVIERLEIERRHPGSTVAQDFARHGGPRYQWGPHLESFYSSTQAFLYELAIWNRNHLKSRMRKWAARHMARLDRPLDVLSIGDGLGFDSLHYARRRHRVTYFELAGPSERFARNLFDKAGVHIGVLTDPASIPAESFDAVTCFDVLEHVPDPPALVKTFASYLRPGGFLYVSAPFYMLLPWYPTHLKANRRFSGSLRMYADAGLRLIDGHITWYPIVLQKEGGNAAPASLPAVAGVRFSGAVQSLGRLAAWPFLPVHLLRRACNRRLTK